MSKPNYKLNVAGILRNLQGRILVCERLNISGAWQFPQGGVDAGETPEEALVRELGEEVGVEGKDFRIVEKRGGYRYLFPKPKKGHDGKDQIYFLCDYIAPDDKINIHMEHPEFQGYRWILPREFQLSWLPEMKVQVYQAVFRDLLGINL